MQDLYHPQEDAFVAAIPRGARHRAHRAVQRATAPTYAATGSKSSCNLPSAMAFAELTHRLYGEGRLQEEAG